VQIDLLIRGICCLRPQLPGVSEKIRVHAVIDRYLEHARIFHFKNGGQDEVFCSSADWMPRNFRRRVEVMFPILDDSLKKRVIEEVLGTMRLDNVKGWLLKPDGIYQRIESDDQAVRSQLRFVELARERSRESEAILGLQAKGLLVATPRALDKLRRRAGKKRKRRARPEE
jgi:polyphosphate kinase